MKDHVRSIARNASVIAVSTLLSRVLGFARDVIIAFALGAGPLADAFFVAFRIPNVLRRLFAEGSLTMAFVPVFTRTRLERGDREAFVLARSTLAWLGLILGAITLIVLAAARPLTMAIAPGFLNDPQIFAQTVTLVRICFPYILFISGVALCMGVLNAMGHFLAPALAPCILNVVLILSALLGVWWGVAVPVALAVGVLVAGLGQWLLQQPFLRQQGFAWRGEWSLGNTGVKRVGRLLLPTVLGAAVYQLNIVLNTVLASFLPRGSISFLYYADRLVQFPLGVFGLALSTAALPSLASLLAQGRNDDFTQTLNSTLGLTLFISLPAMAGLIGLSEPMVQVLFVRGAFDAQAAQATAWALVGYGVGLPAFSLVRSLVSAYYALEDTRTPVTVASACLVLNLCLGLGLMQFIGHVGLALAVSAASWANIALLGFFLRRKLGPWLEASRDYLVMLALSAILGLGCGMTASWGWPSLLGIPVWAAGYVFAARLMGLKEAETFILAAGRRLKSTGEQTS